MNRSPTLKFLVTLTSTDPNFPHFQNHGGVAAYVKSAYAQYVNDLRFTKCTVSFAFPGSPFLASEDRVLGGVIVLRCCRCVEAQPSQNIQGILGKTLIISSLIIFKPHHTTADGRQKIWLLIFKNLSSDSQEGGGGGTVDFLAGGLCFNLHNQALVSHPSSQIQRPPTMESTANLQTSGGLLNTAQFGYCIVLSLPV